VRVIYVVHHINSSLFFLFRLMFGIGTYQTYQSFVILLSFFFLFLVGLEFELRTLSLQAGALHFALVIFFLSLKKFFYYHIIVVLGVHCDSYYSSYVYHS
jgi:hypothetical protein